MNAAAPAVATIALPTTLLRGARRPQVALVGLAQTGKSTIFQAASSTAVESGRLDGSTLGFDACQVNVGLEQASLVDLPSLRTLHDLDDADRLLLMALLRGEPGKGGFKAPDVLIQVVDATALEPNLALAQELCQLGKPLVIALNRLDEARERGIYINVEALSAELGVPVVPTVAHMGKGIGMLFETALNAVRSKTCPLPQLPGVHLLKALAGLNAILDTPEVEAAFPVPRSLLLTQLAKDNTYFTAEMARLFPALLPAIQEARAEAARHLPRPLAEELFADRHYRAAALHEQVTRLGHAAEKAGWKRALDRVFLHPQWGFIGTLAVFALVLFMVFEVSTTLDSITSAPLAAWVGQWEPDTTVGVIGRAVADGLVGLVGIVVPYMLPLVLLLVSLEESGIMHRVAFVVDRGFHRIGLHGGVAVPFLLGLGCNVPALSAVAATSSGRERIVASLLITFVPCSARSAIVLAIGGKYLGWEGVLGIFLLTMLIIAVSGKLLTRRYVQASPGLIQSIPPYALPQWRRLLAITWERTSDILTIVTPLLVMGSVVLALLAHFGADEVVNTLLMPVTHWWLGLPVVLGVPILFGVLRKELSLLMVYQALGTQDIAPLLDWVQITTFLVFLTFYVPCVSTFAVMLKTIGRRDALFSIGLSVALALGIAFVCRGALEAVNWLV
ncbi:ferrous iron transporter B [Zoogloea sp. LCSB751]|uniref:ferrous iron transporter B n=1 Tax=Zoogloea sp. LCSB751 TaxID=1965277 RepID=UPI0009A54208|nr:ferrous iron transporter B [Zoogloea sp. LCSB751]